MGAAAPWAAAAAPQSAEDRHLLAAQLKPPELSDYEARLEKARRLLAQHHMEALYVESGSTLVYFTGINWGRSERMFAVLIPRRGRLAFIGPAFEKQRAEEQIIFADSQLFTWQEHESPYERAGRIFGDRRISSGRIGIEPSTRFFLVSGLRQVSGSLEWVDGSPVSDGCRMTKSPQELEYMKVANLLTKQAYKAALDSLAEGMTSGDLARRIAEEHSKLGVQGAAMVLFGANSAFPHGSRTPRRLREGDVVLIDGGCSVHGYRSDVSRTAVFGKPSPKQRRVWNLVREAQAAALQAARPGMPCQELDRIARQVIQKGGYGPGYRFFTHRLGHGIGLDGHEAPYLVGGNTLPLQPGMTFSNEPGIYIQGAFGVRHEDIMVITESGAEFLGPASESIEEPV